MRELEVAFENKKMEKFAIKREIMDLQDKMNRKKNEVLAALVESELEHMMWTINESKYEGKELEDYLKNILHTVSYKSTLIEKGDM